MISFLKKNKIFSILLFLTLITSIIGLFIPALLKDDDKKIVIENIEFLEKQIQTGSLSMERGSEVIVENIFTTGLIWALGISIIGIPIIIFLYLSKVLLLSTELSFLLTTIKGFHSLWIPIYYFPMFLQMFLLFLLVYYAVNYSLFFIKVLFLKQECSTIRPVTIKYLKILGFSIVITLLNVGIEIYLIPKILKIFI